MSVDLRPLTTADLAASKIVLAAACEFDRADVVAEEKLLGPAPAGPTQAWAAWRDGALVGVASACADRLRLLAVTPAARWRGVGSALLGAVEAAARARGPVRLRTLDQAGNYLAPGIDARNTGALSWLTRRGYTSLTQRNTNLLIDVRTNPRVSPARAAELAAEAARRGYLVRRADRTERPLLAAIGREFGGAWPWEIERALGCEPAAVHVAIDPGGDYAAFAAHDGNNRGLGWFGPAGTWPAHRGRGLGEAVLMACLVDVAAHHATCEVAWIGPRPFYAKAAGIADERSFVVMSKLL